MDFFKNTTEKIYNRIGQNKSPSPPQHIYSFFHNEDIKKMSKEIIKPVVNIIYDEIYPYIWFLCTYNVFLIFITLANLFILIRLYNLLNKRANMGSWVSSAPL